MPFGLGTLILLDGTTGDSIPMAEDALSPWRQDRDRNLAEIAHLEATLSRMQAAGSPAVEPTQRLIAILRSRVAEAEAFLSMHGKSNV